MNVAPQEAVLLAGLTAAAFTDLRAQRVPNTLTFPMMALGIVMTAVTVDWPLFGVVGCAAAFALHYPLFVLGIERGGDAKLLMGLGACVGWREMLESTIWLAVLYLPIGLALLAVQGRLGNLVATARWYVAKQQGRDPGPKPEPTWLRTAPVIAVGGALAWATDWLAFVPERRWAPASLGEVWLSRLGSVLGLSAHGLSLWIGAAGCAYVTKEEYLVEWDEDGDGWPLDEDCEPNNKEIYPYAPDIRGDGCDTDCSTEADADGDDWPDAADCGPEDPTIYPCSQSEVAGDEVDHDCDSFTTKRQDTCPGLDPNYLDDPDVVVGACGDES